MPTTCLRSGSGGRNTRLGLESSSVGAGKETSSCRCPPPGSECQQRGLCSQSWGTRSPLDFQKPLAADGPCHVLSVASCAWGTSGLRNRLYENVLSDSPNLVAHLPSCITITWQSKSPTNWAVPLCNSDSPRSAGREAMATPPAHRPQELEGQVQFSLGGRLPEGPFSTAACPSRMGQDLGILLTQKGQPSGKLWPALVGLSQGHAGSCPLDLGGGAVSLQWLPGPEASPTFTLSVGAGVPVPSGLSSTHSTPVRTSSPVTCGCQIGLDRTLREEACMGDWPW